jgi:hypothetical protein
MAFSLPLGQFADLVPHQLQLHVAGRDAALLRAPAELPQRRLLLLGRDAFGVVVACDVAKA